MNDMIKKLSLVMVFFSCIQALAPPTGLCTDIQGVVTARNNETLMVTFSPEGMPIPQPGDEVAFTVELQGIEVNAGAGKVTEVGAGFVWVGRLTGNANLNHRALIRATGQLLPAAPGEPQQPQPATVQDDSGWGNGGYRKVSPEQRHIGAITAAHQACDFPRALQLAEQARPDIPDNLWLQQNFATLETLARRSGNYQQALNGAYRALEQGQVNESITLLKKAMQNASVSCGQDQQVLSLLEQAKRIGQMERDEAIEQARRKSLANARDSESYRVAIEKRRAEREAIGDLLTGNLLGLLGAFSSGNTSSYPPAESHSDREMVQKLVGESEKNNNEVLNKWRASQGWSTNPGTPADPPTNAAPQPMESGSDLVRELVDKSEQDNSEILNKWRKSQGWE